MKARWILLLLTIGLLAQQCAKQTSPTGGPKDELPPVLERSKPSHKQTNFTGREIELTFDEAIQLNNPREQILITPSIGKKFEALAKKNKVTLTFNAELEKNTTYTVNFRESIQDLTERNPSTVKIAFSTGDYLDSLNIIGSVKDILLDKEAANYTVAVTPASDTFNIFKNSASWVTQADKRGRFSIENLKPGKYFIYAFHDGNKNLIVDAKSEKFGFQSEPINLERNTDSVNISVFKLDASKFKILSARPTFAYYTIRFSKTVVKYQLTSNTSSEKIYSLVEPDLSTIKVFNTIPDLDSLQVKLEAIDSMENKIDTLLFVKFQKKISTKDKPNFKIDYSNFYETKSLLSVSITANKPILPINMDSIYIQADSVNRIYFLKEDFQWNENLTSFTINKKIELGPPKPERNKTEGRSKKTEARTEPVAPTKKEAAKLIISKASLKSVENDTIPLLTSPIKNIRGEDTGIIQTEVRTNESFILQVLDKSGKVIQEVKDIKKYSFENIPAGTYLIRLLVDLNKNGKWDAGNYLKREQPEPVVYYRTPKGSKDTFLKANWHVGELLISY